MPFVARFGFLLPVLVFLAPMAIVAFCCSSLLFPAFVAFRSSSLPVVALMQTYAGINFIHNHPPPRTPGDLHQKFAPTLGLLHPSFCPGAGICGGSFRGAGIYL